MRPPLRQGYGVSYSEGLVLALGGLRGAVGLCLALIVEEINPVHMPTHVKNKIVFHMAGVAFLSLLINGTFMHPIVK